MRHVIALLLAVAFAGSSIAEEKNQIPSCYAANGLPLASARAVREVMVLIDQTTILDAPLQRSVMLAIDGLFTQGVSFSIVRFSAYSQGRYTSIAARGVLEPPLPKTARDAIGVNILKRFDTCMAGQFSYGRRMAAQATAEALAGASGDLSRSDILAALREASVITRGSPAKDRLVIVVSDMLENSSVASFYVKNAIRSIHPDDEMGRAEKAGLLADFGGARVYVIGAGFHNEGKTNRPAAYRAPETMKRLSDFWTKYFAASKATLSGFGQPELLIPIR